MVSHSEVPRLIFESAPQEEYQMAEAKVKTRFAPSPSGFLHLGHAYSALLAHDFALSEAGAFLLRLEDIDVSRSRPEFEEAIKEDLSWLGLRWEAPVRRQSDHFKEYEALIKTLSARGLTYPCFCTRKEIAAEIEAAGAAPHGPDGPIYPGTCKALSTLEAKVKVDAGQSYALRLNADKAHRQLDKEGRLPLTISSLTDLTSDRVKVEPVDTHLFGDVVLARKDVPTSYHLSVVHDDALQGITHVIRGEDLQEATHVHAVLQALLGYEAPIYFHHPLICDEFGRRLAKRDQDQTLRALREAGVTPQGIWALVGINR
jgi:glutamyl-Q tRNA(Asp) synthetase